MVLEYNDSIMTKHGLVTITYDEDGSLRIEGPKKVISGIVGGLGGEEGDKAWVTSSELNTSAKIIFTLLKLSKQRI